MIGPLNVQPLASQIYGFYTALVYLTPIFGGLLADRLLGQRRMVVLGATLMAIGHFLMAIEQMLLLRAARAHPGQRRFSSRISRRKSAGSIRPAIIAATAPIRSFMSASILGRSWRRSSAALSARRPAGITALRPRVSAC